jgi:hypothetical protein
MAGMDIEGLDELIADLQKAGDLSDEVAKEMLEAESQIVIKAHKDELAAQGKRDSGQLIASVGTSGKVDVRGFSHAIDIYPQGVRDDGVRNAEVGFILEFGAPKKHIPASNWMKKANEGCADEAVKAAASVYDEYLKKNNL